MISRVVKSTKRGAFSYRGNQHWERNTDLLDIQNELLRAQIVLVSGQYAEAFARYRVLASTGNLLPSMGVEVESFVTE